MEYDLNNIIGLDLNHQSMKHNIQMLDLNIK